MYRKWFSTKSTEKEDTKLNQTNESDRGCSSTPVTIYSDCPLLPPTVTISRVMSLSSEELEKLQSISPTIDGDGSISSNEYQNNSSPIITEVIHFPNATNRSKSFLDQISSKSKQCLKRNNSTCSLKNVKETKLIEHKRKINASMNRDLLTPPNWRTGSYVINDRNRHSSKPLFERNVHSASPKINISIDDVQKNHFKRHPRTCTLSERPKTPKTTPTTAGTTSTTIRSNSSCSLSYRWTNPRGSIRPSTAPYNVKQTSKLRIIESLDAVQCRQQKTRYYYGKNDVERTTTYRSNEYGSSVKSPSSSPPLPTILNELNCLQHQHQCKSIGSNLSDPISERGNALFEVINNPRANFTTGFINRVQTKDIGSFNTCTKLCQEVLIDPTNRLKTDDINGPNRSKRLLSITNSDSIPDHEFEPYHLNEYNRLHGTLLNDQSILSSPSSCNSIVPIESYDSENIPRSMMNKVGYNRKHLSVSPTANPNTQISTIMIGKDGRRQQQEHADRFNNESATPRWGTLIKTFQVFC